MKVAYQLGYMDTKQECLQKLQQTIISQLAQGHPQPLLNESIYHELQGPPPSDLYPHLHLWYMTMNKKFSQPLQHEEAATPLLDQENDENGLNFIGQDLKTKMPNFNLMATTPKLTTELGTFKTQFVKKYMDKSKQDLKAERNTRLLIQIDIHQKFESLLYQITKSNYLQNNFDTKGLETQFSKLKKDIKDEIQKSQGPLTPQQIIGLSLWIKDQFNIKVNNYQDFKDQIKLSFISPVNQTTYATSLQLPSNKVYSSRIIVVDPSYERIIKLVLKRYNNYQSVIVIKSNDYITNKANYDSLGFKVYNSNYFFSCLQTQANATSGKIPDQLVQLTTQLAKITITKQSTGKVTKFKIDKNCKFYTDNTKSKNKLDNHNNTMSATTPPLWSNNQNKSKTIIITDATITAEQKANVKAIIGVSAPEIATIYNLTRQVKDATFTWNYQWTHILARTLGGKPQWDNGFVGPSFFNRVMQNYQSWLVNVNQAGIFASYNLTKIDYNISVTHPTYTPYPPSPPNQAPVSVAYGLFATKVKIEIIAQYNVTASVPTQCPLLRHQFDPFLSIYPMRIQEQLFQQCVKQLCLVQERRRMFQNNLGANLPSNIGSNNQYYQCIRRNFFYKVRNYFKQNIQGQTLDLNDKGLSLKVEVRSNQDDPDNDNQGKFYSVKILQVQPTLLQKLCGQNILFSSLTQALQLDEISFNMSSNILGFFVTIRSKPFDLPKAIASVVHTIFNFDKPVLILQGSLHFSDNLLEKPSSPDYFQIKATLEESNKSQKNVADLNYSFQNLNLSLQFRHKQKGGYDVDWSIGCLVNIFKLAKDPIKLSATFRHIQDQNQLQAKITEHINELMGVSWISVEQLDLKINFTQQEITLWFAFDISTVRLSMKAFYGSKLISMKCSIEKLSINDILGVINKIVGTQLSVGLGLQFQNISLEIIVDRVNKENIFNFELQFKIGQTTFNGSLHHEKSNLQLIASADIINFDILGEQITLTEPKLSLTTNKQFDQLKYTGTLDYKSKSQGLNASIDTILAVQKLKSSSQNNYWLQAKIRLDLEPTVTKLLECLAALDAIRLVYKSQNYLSIEKGQSDKSGKYLAIETKYFTLFKNRVKLQVIFDFVKLQLSAAVKFDYNRNDKKSFLLLQQIGLGLKLTAVQVRLEAKFISPRLDNVLFTGALIFGPGKVGGELTMQGVVNINSYIQFGFPENSGKKTILSVAYDNEAVDFQISAAIRMHEFYGEGHIKVVADALTYLQVTVQNLDFIKIISSLINSIRSEDKDKDHKREMIKFSNQEANQVKLFVIDRLYFQYDMIKLNIEAQLKATIFDNQFMLNASVNPKGISFQAKIQNPIVIIDLISLSHAEDSSKGPRFNIQLNQKKFKIEASCKIQFGPISSAASIKINSSLVQGSIQLDLFHIFELKANLKIDKQNNNYGFQISFNQSQKNITNSFVGDIIEGKNSNLKQSSSNKYAILQTTRQGRRRTAQNLKQSVKQSRYQFIKKRKSMESLFELEQKIKSQLKKIREENKNEIKTIQKKIRENQKQIREINNYKEYHKNTQLFDINQFRKHVVQGEEKLLILKNEISIFKKQIQKLQNVDISRDRNLLNDLDRPMLKSSNFWNSFKSWVKSAYQAIKQFLQKAAAFVLPRVSSFSIGAFLNKSEFNAHCSFTFTFMELTKTINLSWTGHFDHQIIHQKTIGEMTQFSLTYVRSVYLIPKPIYQKFQFSDIEEVYIAIDDGRLHGLNITYNPSLKKNIDNYTTQYPYLTIGKAQLIDIYDNQTPQQKQKQKKQQQQYQKLSKQQQRHRGKPAKKQSFRYCIAKTLEFTDQYMNNSILKMTKYFCNRQLDYDKHTASVLIGKSKRQDLHKYGFTDGGSLPKLQILNDSSNEYYNLEYLMFFSITDERIDGQYYKKYSLRDSSFAILKNPNNEYQPVIIESQPHLQFRHDSVMSRVNKNPFKQSIAPALQKDFNQFKKKYDQTRSRELKFDELWLQVKAIPQQQSNSLPI